MRQVLRTCRPTTRIMDECVAAYMWLFLLLYAPGALLSRSNASRPDRCLAALGRLSHRKLAVDFTPLFEVAIRSPLNLPRREDVWIQLLDLVNCGVDELKL